MELIKNYIGGKLVEPTSGNYLDNIDPATGRVYSRVPDSDDHDVDRAGFQSGDNVLDLLG